MVNDGEEDVEPVLMPPILVLLFLGIQHKHTAENAGIGPHRAADDSGLVDGAALRRMLVDVSGRMERAFVEAPPVAAHGEGVSLELVRASLLRGVLASNPGRGVVLDHGAVRTSGRVGTRSA